jgi:hypothetical protein
VEEEEEEERSNSNSLLCPPGDEMFVRMFASGLGLLALSGGFNMGAGKMWPGTSELLGSAHLYP